MNSKTKSSFTSLKNNKKFSEVIEKIVLKKYLTTEEQSYVLACSILLLDKYNEEKEEAYLQFAYYLILNYSLTTNDYLPLYQVSIDAGFFPICNYLYGKIEKNEFGIDDYIINSSIKSYFSENEMVYIKDQKEKMDHFLNDESNYKTLIAPTSYGKSSLIKKEILKKAHEKKIGIIVPTKALIWQTFNNLKETGQLLKTRIILHDSEYGGESNFIGIFTQERALRLIEEQDICFDVLYIDEAHNLFEKGDRDILLARLLRINRKKNPNQKVIFLSPLVQNSNNFSFDGIDFISENRISRSIKEYDIRIFKDGVCSYYNRFLNIFTDSEKKYDNAFDYMFKNATSKNLIYFYKPKKVEKFAIDFCEQTEPLNNERLDKIASLVASYTDSNYLMVKMIRRGAIYIHGKVPEVLKDYLYHCFSTVEEIKFLISNNCVLEGVDFPIDSIFVFDTHGLNENKLINLAGRVNRLKTIFGNHEVKLEKLICPIHFVPTKEYCDEDMKKKAAYFRSDVIDDVENPLLDNAKIPKKEEEQKLFSETKARENKYLNDSEIDRINQVFIKNGIDKRYQNYEEAYSKIKDKIINFSGPINDIEQLLVHISEIFINGFVFAGKNMALGRLKHISTLNYYNKYITDVYHSALKGKISYLKNSINYNKESGKNVFVGDTFGTTTLYDNVNDHFVAYINPMHLTQNEIINYAIIKSKVEDDFVDYDIAPFVKAMLDLEIIDEELFDRFMYGTNNRDIVEYCKLGFSPQLIKFIVENNLLLDIINTGYGLIPTTRFLNTLETQDELIKFEIKKYLII